MTVKKTLAPKCRLKCSRGFHVTLIHQIKAFFDGQIPTKFSIRAWSLMYYKCDLKPSSLICNEGISLFWLCIFWRYALALFLFMNLYPWCLLSSYSDDLCPCPCWLRSLRVGSRMVITRPQWECDWRAHIRLIRTADWAYGRLSLAGGRLAIPRQNRARLRAWGSRQKPYAASNAIEEIMSLLSNPSPARGR